MNFYSIYYMRPEWFREGIMYAKPDPKNLAATHIHLKNVEADDLDAVYWNMQGEIWSPNGEARDLIKAKGLRHTSMSIGDVIVANGIAHVVASAGFDELGPVS